MADVLPALETFRRAAATIRPHIHRTPLWRSEYLSKQSGRDVWLKLESFQKTGSFKPRGALVNLMALSGAERERGVIAISSGNHAQATAWAAAKFKTPCTVVMPEGSPGAKVAACRGYGAEVVLHGDRPQAFAKFEELRAQRNLVPIHPYDSVRTVTGTGTIALEILEDLPRAAALAVGIGGGGLISGVALAAHCVSPQVKVFGVEPEGAAAMAMSLEQGRVVTLGRIDTIADGLCPPSVGELNYRICKEHLAGVARVTDDEIREAVRVLFARVKAVVEPSGAAALAALLAGKVDLPPGPVVAVVSGGNVDPGVYAEMLKE